METHPWADHFSEGLWLLKRIGRLYVSNQQPANLQTAQVSTKLTSALSVIADLMMGHTGDCNPKSQRLLYEVSGNPHANLEL